MNNPSNNDAYEGVRGGNPAMRPAQKKPVNSLTPEQKKARDRINAERSQENKRKAEEGYQAREQERRREEALRPIRSEDERQALLVQYAANGYEMCKQCRHEYIVAQENDPFIWDDPEKIGAIINIQWMSDPFQAEIHDDHTPMWICTSCQRISLDEI